jgi:hypothetical protein
MMGLFRPARVKCWEREIPLIDLQSRGCRGRALHGAGAALHVRRERLTLHEAATLNAPHCQSSTFQERERHGCDLTHPLRTRPACAHSG